MSRADMTKLVSATTEEQAIETSSTNNAVPLDWENKRWENSKKRNIG